MLSGLKHSRLLRFFVELPGDAPTSSESSLAEHPNLVPVGQLVSTAPVFEQTLQHAEGQPLDFAAIYAAAKVEQRTFTGEKALEMIRKFPDSLTLDTKRATATVALDAMGLTGREVLQDAAEKIAALEVYAATGANELKTLEQEADQRIIELEKQIQEWKEIKRAKRGRQEQLAAGCNAQADQLEAVVDFFTPDVPPPATV